VNANGGVSTATDDTGGDVVLLGGTAGGMITVKGGFYDSTSGDQTGGSIYLTPSLGNGSADGSVYIGGVSVDSTAQLLVLDTKDTVGDPTGINGAMYYNSSTKVMRCYVNSAWQHCNDPTRMTLGYNIQEEFIGEGSGTNNGQGWTCGSGTIGIGTTHSWNCNGTGADSTINSVVADTFQRPGQIQLNTGTSSTINSIVAMLGGTNSKPFIIGGGETYETAINIPTLSNGTDRYIARFGLCDASETHNTDCTNGVYFEYDSNTSANWRYATAAAGTRTKTSSTKAVAVGWTNLKWVVNSAGTNVNFYVKSAADPTYVLISASPIATNIPTTSANATRMLFSLDKFAGSSNRTFTIDYVDYFNDFTTRR
jgi:hypothetical protein